MSAFALALFAFALAFAACGAVVASSRDPAAPAGAAVESAARDVARVPAGRVGPPAVGSIASAITTSTARESTSQRASCRLRSRVKLGPRAGINGAFDGRYFYVVSNDPSTGGAFLYKLDPERAGATVWMQSLPETTWGALSLANGLLLVPNLVRVAPFDPDQSLLVMKLEHTQACGGPMPNAGTPLPSAQLQQVRTWIANGAAND